MTQNTAKATQEWLKKKRIEVLEWPSQSHRKSLEGAEGSSCQTSALKPQLHLEDLQREVRQNPPEMCTNLVANYKKYLTSVIANKGFSTKFYVILAAPQPQSTTEEIRYQGIFPQ